MAKAKANATAKVKKTDGEPELEVNASWNGPEFWKDWGGNKKKGHGGGGGGGGLYFLGFLGALVYNMQAAVGFGAVVTGFLKALVWPAYVVYKLMEVFYGVVN